ncbi:MAG: hypothetical protein KC619_04565 [Myxococcales bacterium]|nr:hypothetical protein [Myxococcales bacterium]
MDELNALSVGSALLASLGWLVATGALFHGAFARSGSARTRFTVAGLIQLGSGPAVVAASWWLASAMLARFGAEGQTLAWLAELTPAAALASIATAVVAVLVARPE